MAIARCYQLYSLHVIKEHLCALSEIPNKIQHFTEALVIPVGLYHGERLSSPTIPTGTFHGQASLTGELNPMASQEMHSTDPAVSQCTELKLPWHFLDSTAIQVGFSAAAANGTDISQ